MANYRSLGGLWHHLMRAQILRSWGRAMSLIGVRLFSLATVTCTFTACSYSQQVSLPTAPSNVLSNAARQLTPLIDDGYRFISCPEQEDFQNTALSSLQWKFYFKQDESAMDQYWFSPFTSRGAGSRNCSACTRRVLRSGKSACAENYGRFDGVRFASVSLGANSQQSSPPSQKDEPSVETGSPKHIFVFVPAFHVSYLKQFKPLTPREKFDEWAHGTYDPRGLLLYAGEAATLEHSSRDGFCGYGKRFGGYGKCFGSMELDANISSFFGDFLFPVVLHQDPRFFRLGEGPFRVRLAYALSRVFVTHADSGRTVFFSSATAGSVLVAAASNLYFPAQDRGVGPSLHRLVIDFADTALFNVAAEFWPDISQELGRVLPKP